MGSRASIVLASIAFALAGSTCGQAPAAKRSAGLPRPIFFVTGHGWGHGIGLSQYGAYGYAQHGLKYDKIVAHYYPGTTLGQAPSSKVRAGSSMSSRCVTAIPRLASAAAVASGTGAHDST